MNRFVAFLAITFMVSSSLPAYELVSPDKKIKVDIQLQDNAQPSFKIEYADDQKSVEVLPVSPLGLKTTSQDFSKLTLVSQSGITAVHDQYDLLQGKRRHCENSASEITFRLKNPADKCIDLVFRAYDNGVAFRYILPEYDQELNSITEELTAFNIPDGVNRWIQSFQGSSYEDYYPLSTKNIANKNLAFPALFNIENNIFILLTEADISRYNYGSSLFTGADGLSYKIALPQGKDSNGFTLPWQSPWRVVMVGKLSDIVESTLVTDLSSPNKLAQTDWVKPGSASWIYWANNHGTKDYSKLVEYVDLAEYMNWPYTLIDWEWDQMSNGGNIVDIVNYAKSKNIKPLMWYNSGTAWMDPTPNDRMNSPERRAKEFAWLNQIGVYGIKVDFFPDDKQKTMNHYISLLEDAARYKLMVVFHGCTLPRGWERTYPNLMTMEGVYGAEQYNNGRSMTEKGAEHNATLVYTRNVVGSMDYTPVAFTDSQHKHTTSFAHELALAVVFESGIVHFADRPSGFMALPDPVKNYLRNFPTAWDDTKLIDGYPGKLVIMARKAGDKWYVAGINGENVEKTVKVNFAFLAANAKYELTLHKDGADTVSFDTSVQPVDNTSVIEIKLQPRGGFAGVVNAGQIIEK